MENVVFLSMDALSYWEHKHWLSNIDYAVIGSGIVGLSCALSLREKHPKSTIVVFEKGILPHGASTKNAGFTCFGSISEILSDIDRQGEQNVLNIVQRRYEGVQLLRSRLGDTPIGYENLGGHEVFLAAHTALYETCLDQLTAVNSLLQPVFKSDSFYTASNRFNFKGVNENYISSPHEGQIDTGLMMKQLIRKVQAQDIHIFYGTELTDFSSSNGSVHLKTNFFECKAGALFIATNGFSKSFQIEDVSPARAQVLITKPIENLHIKGAFHLDMGYYYFRNIDQRILLGGGRNLALKEEETTDFSQTSLIQDALDRLLKETILPGVSYEIDRRWSGIMGVGAGKEPLLKCVQPNVYCGVRLGGMGVALGSKVGIELADLHR